VCSIIPWQFAKKAQITFGDVVRLPFDHFVYRIGELHATLIMTVIYRLGELNLNKTKWGQV
jgi:hypothetical protein